MLVREFNGAFISVWVLEESGQVLENRIIVAHEQIIDGSQKVSLSADPIAARVIAEGSSVVFSPWESRPKISEPPYLPVDQATSVMIVPVRAGGAVTGVLCIRASVPDQTFTLNDVLRAQTLSGTVANVIESTRHCTPARIALAQREHTRVIYELHDSVRQALFAANLTAEILPMLWERDSKQGKRALEDMHRFTQSALAEMQLLGIELYPGVLANTPLHELLNTLHVAASAKSHSRIRAHIDQTPNLPIDTKITLYRLAQAALNKIMEHSTPRYVSITLKVTPASAGGANGLPWQGKVALRIGVDEPGLDALHGDPDRLGIESMREMVRGIGAQLNISSRRGKGTQIDVTWISRAVPVEAA
jgi:signal transduction histidine kinase